MRMGPLSCPARQIQLQCRLSPQVMRIGQVPGEPVGSSQQGGPSGRLRAGPTGPQLTALRRALEDSYPTHCRLSRRHWLPGWMSTSFRLP
jgi:hypothetical protein